MRWVDLDQPDEEKERLKKLVCESPDNANAHYELGTAYACLLDFARAKECCEKAINLDPRNISFWAFFAFASAKNGDDQDAIEALTTLVELDADDGNYHVDLAIDAEFGMDNELVWHQIENLKNSGKERIAKKLRKWLIDFYDNGEK